MPQRTTSSVTWPGPGVGAGRSATSSSARWQTTARIGQTLDRGVRFAPTGARKPHRTIPREGTLIRSVTRAALLAALTLVPAGAAGAASNNNTSAKLRNAVTLEAVRAHQ